VLSRTGVLFVNDGDADGVGVVAGGDGAVQLETLAEQTKLLKVFGTMSGMEGTSFVIERRLGGTVLADAVFEFDSDGTRSIPGSLLVPYHAASTADELASAIADQIGIADIGLFPHYVNHGMVHLGSRSEVFVVEQLPNLATVVGPGIIYLNGLTLGDMVLATNVRSDSGDIRVCAGDDLMQNSDLTTGGTGTVSVTAPTGEITMADGTTTTSTRGPITYRAAGDVAVSVLTSTEGSIQVTADSDGDNLGAIRDATAAEDANLLTGATVTLAASSGIGGAGEADIDTMVGTLEATNGGSDDVVIQEMAGLSVTGAGLRTAGGTVHLDVDAGDLTIASTVAASAAGAVGQIKLAVASGSILLEDAARLQTAGGEVKLDAGLAISMAKGSVVNAGGGAVELKAAYGVLLSRIVSPSASVTIDAGRGGIADGVDPADPPDPDGADIEADTAILTAEGSIGTRVDNTPLGTVVIPLETKVRTLKATFSGVGIFLVNEGLLDTRIVPPDGEDGPPGIVDIVCTSEAGLIPCGGEVKQGPPGRLDVNGDGIVTPLDVLLVISALNQSGLRRLPASPDHTTYPSQLPDVDGDLWLTPADALLVITYLNRQTSTSAEAEAGTRFGLAYSSEPAPHFRACRLLDILLLPDDKQPDTTCHNFRDGPGRIQPG
jgi:hypothetical protein